MIDKIHKFELAGLGVAPYQCVGVETAADRAGEQRHREANGMMFTTNYSTSCDYCSTGIQNAYMLESADGRRFKVGCECIRKSGDKGLIAVVDNAEKSRRRTMQTQRRLAAKARRAARVAAALDAWHAGRCESLRDMSHPNVLPGKSAWDYVDWCVNHGCVGDTALRLLENASDVQAATTDAKGECHGDLL